MSQPPTCAVIGAGIIGASTAYALARRGVDVTVFEQFDLFHDRGSSHGATRLFRTAYFEHSDYVPLLQRAGREWRALEEQSGEELLWMSGALIAGPASSDVIRGTRKASGQHGLSLTELEIHDLRQKFPWLASEKIDEAIIEPAAGVIFAGKALRAFIAGAKQCGAEFVPHAQINVWKETKDGVALNIAGELRKFDYLAITPGSYAQSLLGGIGPAITPRRKTLFWTGDPQNRFGRSAGMTPFAIETPDHRFFYGFPTFDQDGVKYGEHTGGVDLSDPLKDAPEERRVERGRLERFLKSYAPHLPQEITREQTCLYAMSPDGHFVIDKHPSNDKVVFATGLSGHGFKFAPVIGQALADLILKGEAIPEFEFLSLKRFNE